ncbi:MAG: protein kinase [Gammaproteobacteria bacterium]|nr:protein kinase [Gammaproteobacteria bacterium]
MNILIAPSGLKESISARHVAKAIARGIRKKLPATQIELSPLADGGEGFSIAVCPVQSSCGIKHNPSDVNKLPQKVGKYEIRSSLGEGAMGIVYEAFDPDIRRRVAIKVLHPRLSDKRQGEEFLGRFKREAQSAARCTHPNIVTILEYGQDGDMPFIVMEFVEGSSLQDLIKLGQGISLQKTLSIISQLLKALQVAHRLRIIHRDIKSANVMILKDGGGVKLADFGIAGVADRAELTMTGAVVGTPKYMAPEQVFGLKVDSRADLFSVAVVFLEMLKLLPRSAAIPLSSLPEIVNLPPNNKIDYSILYPTALIPVLTKGLAVAQKDRYQTAREFVQGIKDVLPKLKSTVSDCADDPTAVTQKSKQTITTSDDELDSMTRLLIDYVGPIAKNIMIAHDAKNTSVTKLATEISRGIPKPEEREAFLRRWEHISETRLSISRHGDSITSPDHSGTRSFDKGMLEN